MIAMIAINVKHYIFYSFLCYIQTGKKLLKIVNTIIQSTANLKKTAIVWQY